MEDIILNFKKRKYPINFARKENLPTITLENELDQSEILLTRKNRQDWKVYMNLNTLDMMLLHKRS